jgi:hypothetical protein
MISVNVEFPADDIAAMRDTFARYVAWFRKGPQEAVKKTCVYVVRSFRASTRLSAKQRKVVRNPNYRKPTSKRARQLQHIRAWYLARGRAAPKDTAEYFDRFAIERLTQRKGTRYTPIRGLAASVGEAKRIAQATMFDQLQIKRRGLAKSSWGWMLGKLGKSESVDQGPISGTVAVEQGTTGGAFEAYFVDLINRLSYIRRATKASVSGVLGRAQRAMKDEMEGHIKRARQNAGLRAA